jgi:protein-S-isoprenylcysteine O-methyltransferase Ste14
MDLTSLSVSAAVAIIAAALAPFITALFTSPKMSPAARRFIAGVVAVVLGLVVAVGTGLLVGVPPEVVAWTAQALVTVAIVVSLAQGFYAQWKGAVDKLDRATSDAENLPAKLPQAPGADTTPPKIE